MRASSELPARLRWRAGRPCQRQNQPSSATATDPATAALSDQVLTIKLVHDFLPFGPFCPPRRPASIAIAGSGVLIQRGKGARGSSILEIGPPPPCFEIRDGQRRRLSSPCPVGRGRRVCAAGLWAAVMPSKVPPGAGRRPGGVSVMDRQETDQDRPAGGHHHPRGQRRLQREILRIVPPPTRQDRSWSTTARPPPRTSSDARDAFGQVAVQFCWRDDELDVGWSPTPTPTRRRTAKMLNRRQHCSRSPARA